MHFRIAPTRATTTRSTITRATIARAPLVLLLFLASAVSVLADDGGGDPTFGDGGRKIISWNGGLDIGRAKSALPLADGSLLVGGEVNGTSASPDFAVAKLTAAGDVDTSWGTGGGTRFSFTDPLRTDRLLDMVELPDHSVLLAGLAEVDGPDPETTREVPALAKLTPQGFLDGSFGTAGRAIAVIPWATDYIPFQRPIHQLDGKTLYLATCTNCPDNPSTTRLVVLRLTTAGAPDPGFSGDGWFTSTGEPFSNLSAYHIAVDAAGRILILAATSSQFALLRLTPGGAVDTSFGGGDGWVTWPIPTGASNSYTFALDANSRAMFVGCNFFAGPNAQFTGVMRLTPAGAVDPTYAGDGFSEIAFGAQLWLSHLQVQTDGKLVGVGSIRASTGANRNFVLVRLRADGALDPEFDADGARNVSFGQTPDGDDIGNRAALWGGRLIAVGEVIAAGVPQFGISRSVSQLIFTDGFERGTVSGWNGS